jgi:hypothetical protein
MSFTINDIMDLKRVLIEHPEWRAELRELILTDELVALPRAFAESRASFEGRFDRIENALERLAQAQARTEQRVDELVQAQARTEQRIEELAQAQARTEAAIKELAVNQKLMGDRQDNMIGTLLEMRYAQRATSYFGKFLRRIRTILPDNLDRETEELFFSRLADWEREDALAIDILLTGRLIHPPSPDFTDLFLAVEVSFTVDRNDIERAQRRTELFRKAGLRVIPVVAGEQLTAGASDLLDDAPVLLMLDGHSQGWERALNAA